MKTLKLTLNAIKYQTAILLSILLLVAVGCSPQKYILSADREALQLIDCTRNDQRWLVQDYRFLPEPDSRLYMNYDQETPCRPLDDPVSHQYMQCVDGKRGWRGWDKYGVEPSVDSMRWLNSMESENGVVVVDRNKAVELALKHSREYQTAREGLYLSALSVTLQRFNLEVQPYYTASERTHTQFDGYNTQTLTNSAGISKATAAGGTILANLANSIVWTFGSDGSSHVGTTMLSYSFAQPLLQYAGRAYALENLTQAERNLLANVRQMEQYRQGFYVGIVAGLSSASAPSEGAASTGSGRVSYGGVGGFYGLLKSQMELNNQQANVDSLKDSLDRMQANCDANRITSYQVDQTRQSLYQSQLNLLSKQNSYNNSVDQFKITLGLPPELKVEIQDSLLDSFELIDSELKRLQKKTELTVVDIRSGVLKGTNLQNRVKGLLAQSAEQMQLVRNDVQALIDISPRRRSDLTTWHSQSDRWGKQMDLSIFDPSLFDIRINNITRDAKALFAQIESHTAELNREISNTDKEVPDGLDDDIYTFNSLLLELILIQGRARLDSITLAPINMDPECAIEVARTHRLDWMNARAALVDKWRQIEIAKNALKAGLQLTFDGQTSATDLSNLHGTTTSTMSLGVQFDAPLTRLKERNAYRRALISYYQSHRQFMAYEDNVRENIREILRKIDLCQMTFELQRASVLVSMSQYDQRRLQLERPPKPNETSSFGDSFARDLIEALDSLLTSQNQIMNDWLEYEAMRMVLDYALGTMRIDNNGLWVDPGSMTDICPAAAARNSEADSLTPAEMYEQEETANHRIQTPELHSIKDIVDGVDSTPKSDEVPQADSGVLPIDKSNATPINEDSNDSPVTNPVDLLPLPFSNTPDINAAPAAETVKPKADANLLPEKRNTNPQVDLPLAPLPEADSTLD